MDVTTPPRLRTVPEDFVVEEIPLYRPTGDGDHTWLWVEKRLLTTDQALANLARATGASRAELGAAGRKDRVAVARQWLSVPGLDPARVDELELGPDLLILAAQRHRHKLRTGDLLGNRFVLTLRGVDPGLAAQADERLAVLARRGLPNRFGEQRFGRYGDNARRGAEILHGGRRPGDRRQAVLLVAAFQAQVFNEVLTARSETYDRRLPGDLLLDHRSGLVTPSRDPEVDARRLADFEASPTGPLFGTKTALAREEAGELERRILAAHDIDPRRLRPPRGLTVAGERRSLRVRLGEPTTRLEDDRFILEVTLPAGSFATVLIEDLFPAGVVDVSRPGLDAAQRSTQ